MFPKDASAAELFWILLSPVVSLTVVVVIHEAGHVIAGIVSGFRLIHVRVGPLAVNWPLRINWSAAGERRPAGITYLVPTHVGRLRERSIAMLLGGPTANLLTGLLCILFISKFSAFTWVLVFFSMFTGIGNLLPFRRRAMLSDGKRVLLLLRNRSLGERWLAVIQLGADLRNGVAPENLRDDLLALATAVQDDSADTIAAYSLAYAKAYFQRRDDEAAGFLEICLQRLNVANQMLREAFFLRRGHLSGEAAAPR